MRMKREISRGEGGREREIASREGERIEGKIEITHNNKILLH